MSTEMRRLCACGCGVRVKRSTQQWATPQCVPHTVRSEGAKKGRRNYAAARRTKFFAAELARLDRTITRGELLAVFMGIYTRGWDTGYHAAEGKWLARRISAA